MAVGGAVRSLLKFGCGPDFAHTRPPPLWWIDWPESRHGGSLGALAGRTVRRLAVGGAVLSLLKFSCGRVLHAPCARVPGATRSPLAVELRIGGLQTAPGSDKNAAPPPPAAPNGLRRRDRAPRAASARLMRRPIDLAICGAVASAHLLRTDGPPAEPTRRAFLSQGPPCPGARPKMVNRGVVHSPQSREVIVYPPVTAEIQKSLSWSLQPDDLE